MQFNTWRHERTDNQSSIVERQFVNGQTSFLIGFSGKTIYVGIGSHEN